MPYTYLITGANRGIGFGLVERLSQRPGVLIFAGIRDISKKEAVESLNAKAGQGSKVIAVQIRAANTDDLDALPSVLSQHGVNHLDVVVANAGIANHYGPTVTTPLQEFRDHFEVNTIGFVSLFQATWPFQDRSEKPKFIYISSTLASMGLALPIPAAAYGASKAAGNYVITKLHNELPKLTTFALCPGWVQTDMGNQGARSNGMDEAPETLEGSVSGILNRIDNATRETDGGKFKSHKEDDLLW